MFAPCFSRHPTGGCTVQKLKKPLEAFPFKYNLTSFQKQMYYVIHFVSTVQNTSLMYGKLEEVKEIKQFYINFILILILNLAICPINLLCGT